MLKVVRAQVSSNKNFTEELNDIKEKHLGQVSDLLNSNFEEVKDEEP